MGSRTQASSDTSSCEENDRQEQVNEDSTIVITTSKRSYECTFCKRGFTNAQALGGHMNIHRKDRAKSTKQVGSSSSFSSKINEEHINPNFVGSVSSDQNMNYYQVLESQRNYPVFYQQSGSSSPRLPRGNCYDHGNDNFLAPRNRQSLSVNEELWGANLSLQIGSNHLENNGTNLDVSKEEEVDLELRLGHDRYYIY